MFRSLRYRVNPPVMDLGVRKSMGSLYVEIARPQEGNFFMKGQMSWKLNPEDQPVELIPLQGFYQAKNRYAIQDGGYYQSKSVPNTGMIAGQIFVVSACMHALNAVGCCSNMLL